MPRRTQMCRRGGALRLAGGSRIKKVIDFLKKANKFLRNTKGISRASKFYSGTSLPYAANVGVFGEKARSLGYGRKCAKNCRRRKR
jgi:hypothetical protein